LRASVCLHFTQIMGCASEYFSGPDLAVTDRCGGIGLATRRDLGTLKFAQHALSKRAGQSSGEMKSLESATLAGFLALGVQPPFATKVLLPFGDAFVQLALALRLGREHRKAELDGFLLPVVELL
jgi:hypothetical protein